MDHERFEQLTRILADRVTRRGALGMLAGVAALGLSEVAAKRRHQGKKQRGGGRGRLGAEAKPVRTPDGFTFDETSDACGFPIDIHTEATKNFILDFGDRQTYLWPGAKSTFTNPATGVSRRVPINGPEFDRTNNEDGTFTFSGSGPWTWYPELPETGEIGIWFTNGRFVLVFEADDNLISAKFAGRSENLCESLA